MTSTLLGCEDNGCGDGVTAAWGSHEHAARYGQLQLKQQLRNEKQKNDKGCKNAVLRSNQPQRFLGSTVS